MHAYAMMVVDENPGNPGNPGWKGDGDFGREDFSTGGRLVRRTV
jgi:hypothetical protein